MNQATLNWLNYLPPLKDKSILKLGTRKIENIKCLINTSCKSLTCLGPRIYDYDSDNLNYCQNIRDLNTSKYDICLIDEHDYFDNQVQIERIYRIIASLLSDYGILLVGLQNRLKEIRRKIYIKNLFYRVGFKTVETFICEPSFDEPFVIYPLSIDQQFTYTILKKSLFREFKIKHLIKDAVRFVSLLTHAVNPFWGMFIIASKSSDEVHRFSNNSMLEDYYDRQNIDKNNIYAVWMAKRNSSKQVGVIYYGKGSDKTPMAVCKQADKNRYRSDVIKREFTNIETISKYAEEFRKNNILIPQPIYYDIKDEKHISIESAIRGNYLLTEIRQKGMLKSSGLSTVRSTLDEVISMQIEIQNILTKNVKSLLPRVSKRYFENALFVQYPWFNDTDRTDLYSEYIQHGDFTGMNIVYDDRQKLWGIIDWEWLASGFPYLFDLFYLFTSLEFREQKRKKDSIWKQYFQSFEDTYFKKNWYSDYINEAIFRCSEYYDVDRKRIFEYFMDFLLFHYNKYRLDYNVKEYVDLYTDMILFSIENKSRFIVNRN